MLGTLSHFNLPISDHIGTASTENRLILDELAYDSHTLAASVENDVPRLNTSQKLVFNEICTSVFNNEGCTFFVYGYGGTGKTFLWTTLLCTSSCFIGNCSTFATWRQNTTFTFQNTT
jgi:hypothetical protein